MSIAQQVREGRVGSVDLDSFVSLEETTPVRDVVEAMRGAGGAAALLTREGRLSGIFTARDVLHKVIPNPAALQRPVRDLMTPAPVTVDPEESLLGALRQMNAGHFRHLPVLDDGDRPRGNLTDYSLVRHLCEHLPAEVLNLPPDPNQVPQAVEGS